MKLRYVLITIAMLAAMMFAVKACSGGDGGSGGTGQSVEVSAIVISPRAALLTESGQTRQLTPTVYDAAGNEISVKMDWSSSHPTVISVDDNGVVTSLATVGSALITASYGKAVSNEVMVLIAKPVAGAMLISDDQIVEEIVPEYPDASWGLGMQFRTRLSGIALPKEGTLLLGTGEKPLGGQVVTAVQVGNDVEVVVETVTIEEMFTELVIDEQVKLSHEVPTLAQIFADNYEVNWLPGGTLEFTLREKALKSAALPARVGVPMGTSVLNPDANHGPFECIAGFANPLVLDGFPTSLSVTNNLEVDIDYSILQGGLQHLLLLGDVKGTYKVANTLSAVLQGKVSCKTKLGEVPVPFPGALGQFLYMYIPIGVGFELDGKITVAQLGFELEMKARGDVKTGMQCPGGSCDMVAQLDTNSSAAFRWITPDFSTPLETLAQLRLEPSLSGFVFSSLQVGAAPPLQLRAEILQMQAGVKQAGNFALVEGQMDDESYSSDYLLSKYGSVGAGMTIDSFANFMQINIAKAELKLTDPLAESPKALKAVSDVKNFVSGNKVTFTVSLDPQHINYPIIGYNVSKVLIYRRTKDDLGKLGPADLLAEVVPAQDQTQVVIEWTADVDGTIEGDYFAFVETEALPFPYFGRLEVAEITVDQECEYTEARQPYYGYYAVTAICGNTWIRQASYKYSPYFVAIEMSDRVNSENKWTTWLNHNTVDFSHYKCKVQGTGWVVTWARDSARDELFLFYDHVDIFPKSYRINGVGKNCWPGYNPYEEGCGAYSCPPIDSIQPALPFPGDCHEWWDHFDESGTWVECDY